MDSIDFSLFVSGGPVIWVLALVSLCGFLIFVERALFLHKGQIRTENFLDGIQNLIRKDRRLEALTLCEDIPGPVPGVVKAILLHSGAGQEALRQVASEAAMVEIPALERRIGAIAAIARIAPLLGLLGTVLGMLNAFLNVQSSGAAYPHFGAMMEGIGQALITTAFGLVIAVMALIAHHFLHGRVRALVHDMEYSGHNLIQFLTNPDFDESAKAQVSPSDANTLSS